MHEGLRCLVQHAFGDVSDEVLALAALGRQGQDVSSQELRAQPATDTMARLLLTSRL